MVHAISPMDHVYAAGLAVAYAREDHDLVDRILERADKCGSLHDLAEVLAHTLAIAVCSDRMTITEFAAMSAERIIASVAADAAAGAPFADGPDAATQAAGLRDYAARTDPGTDPPIAAARPEVLVAEREKRFKDDAEWLDARLGQPDEPDQDSDR